MSCCSVMGRACGVGGGEGRMEWEGKVGGGRGGERKGVGGEGWWEGGEREGVGGEGWWGEGRDEGRSGREGRDEKELHVQGDWSVLCYSGTTNDVRITRLTVFNDSMYDVFADNVHFFGTLDERRGPISQYRYVRGGGVGARRRGGGDGHVTSTTAL